MKNIFTKSNAFGLGLFFANAITFVFMLVYSIMRTQNTATNVFAVFMLITISVDMVYGLITKSKYGLYLILGIMLLITINFGAVYLVTLIVFTSSLTIAGTAALMLIPLASGALIIKDFIKADDHIVHPVCKFYKKIVSGCIICLPIALLFVCIFGYDLAFGGNAYLNILTSNTPLLFLPFIWGASLVLLRIIKESQGGLKSFFKKAPYAIVIIPIIALAFSSFFMVQMTVIRDNSAAKQSYIKAFGDSVFYNEDPSLRKTPYSLADDYFGIKTANYQMESDIVYYIGDNDYDLGLTLRYDMFYPTFEGACKSVLVNIHGSGVDKEVLPQKNKYFASLGYVVYDIQVGDYNEKGTGFGGNMEDSGKRMSQYILEFFKYARDNNTERANFQSVFISGMSMGGSLTLRTGLNNITFFEEEGITLKGLIPFYQGYWHTSEENYLSFITAESVPCLLIMGKKDGIVLPESTYFIMESYEKANNPNVAAVWLTYAGHSFDTRFTAPNNQLAIYYMQRFMLQMR